MKHLIPCLAVLSLVACGGAPEAPFVPTISLPPGPAALTVKVERVKTTLGPVFCDLFNAAEGFPGPSPIIGGSISLEATAEPVCTWKDLPVGEYAVSVIQDENNNGTLDTSAFGAPVEGYGVSNNVLPAASAPRWSDARITLDGTSPMTLTVRLQN
jgi:uncharacterized protein (DUF2141 family)